MRPLIITFLLSVLLTGCGYDGHYRYPCQDPANWGAKECVPPLCEASGTCTVDLLGYDPLTQDGPAESSAIIEEDITDEPQGDDQ
jgi:hypothetical protein